MIRFRPSVLFAAAVLIAAAAHAEPTVSARVSASEIPLSGTIQLS